MTKPSKEPSRTHRAASVIVAVTMLAAPSVVMAQQPTQTGGKLVVPSLPGDGRNDPTVDPAKLADFEREVAIRRAAADANPQVQSWQDAIELGRLEMAAGRYDAAANAFEMSVAFARSPGERAQSRYRWGTALSTSASLRNSYAKSLGDKTRGALESEMALELNRRAGRILNDAQRDALASKEIALARISAWNAAGDVLKSGRPPYN